MLPASKLMVSQPEKLGLKAQMAKKAEEYAMQVDSLREQPKVFRDVHQQIQHYNFEPDEINYFDYDKPYPNQKPIEIDEDYPTNKVNVKSNKARVNQSNPG